MTATPKVLALVSSCNTCQNREYISVNHFSCRLVGQPIIENDIVAPFCPLTDYPANTIAQMQMTILAVRQALSQRFGTHLLTYIAAKLKRTLNAYGSGLTIAFDDMGVSREVYLGLENVLEIKVQPFEVQFLYRDTAYIVSPDASPPMLRKALNADRASWHHYELTV